MSALNLSPRWWVPDLWGLWACARLLHLARVLNLCTPGFARDVVHVTHQEVEIAPRRGGWLWRPASKPAAVAQYSGRAKIKSRMKRERALSVNSRKQIGR